MKALEVTFDRITAKLDEKMTQKLIERFGGQRFQIPDCCDKTSLLTGALGASAARILIKCFGGRVIDVLTATEYRRRGIFCLGNQGKSPIDIARRIGCTQRYVLDVLAEQHYRATYNRDQ